MFGIDDPSSRSAGTGDFGRAEVVARAGESQSNNRKIIIREVAVAVASYVLLGFPRNCLSEVRHEENN